MHACGHDGHCSMLLAAARILVNNRSQIHGTGNHSVISHDFRDVLTFLQSSSSSSLPRKDLAELRFARFQSTFHPLRFNRCS